jgi:hypothetical protein
MSQYSGDPFIDQRELRVASALLSSHLVGIAATAGLSIHSPNLHLQHLRLGLHIHSAEMSSPAVRVPVRRLGSQGLQASVQGLGCMGMSFLYTAVPQQEEESIATIHRALELGVTHLDTSDVYGPFTNEVLVGACNTPPTPPNAAPSPSVYSCPAGPYTATLLTLLNSGPKSDTCCVVCCSRPMFAPQAKPYRAC